MKVRPEDFLVEEIPAYAPSGEGEHLYLFIEKRNLSTAHLMRLLASHYGVHRNAIGVAGLKDKHAVTRQMVSVHLPGKAAVGQDAKPFEHEQVVVHWSDRHANKLRRGHLIGNRFIIRVRNVEPTKVIYANRVLRTLAKRGVPNRIGPQRFGHLEHNHLVGRALMKFDHAEALTHLLGPNALYPQAQREAREAYAAGDYQKAMELLPRAAHTERRVLSFLARGRSVRDAARAIEPLEYSFFLTALQSAVFNRVLDERLRDGTFDRLLPGDLAFKHANGSVFPVDEQAMNEPEIAERLAKIEISPSGPMWAAGMMRAGGEVDTAERRALESLGLTIEALDAHGAKTHERLPGERRPLRVPLSYPDVEAGMDEHGAYIKCVFELPRGAFATTVMAEVMKPSLPSQTDATVNGNNSHSNDEDEPLEE